jgi:hypothetical protein
LISHAFGRDGAQFGLSGPKVGDVPLSLATLREAQTVQDGSTDDYTSTMVLLPKLGLGFIGLIGSKGDKEGALDTLAIRVLLHVAHQTPLPD